VAEKVGSEGKCAQEPIVEIRNQLDNGANEQNSFEKTHQDDSLPAEKKADKISSGNQTCQCNVYHRLFRE
jgi:hypothetical protein